jgi:hypothetical protein
VNSLLGTLSAVTPTLLQTKFLEPVCTIIRSMTLSSIQEVYC